MRTTPGFVLLACLASSLAAAEPPKIDDLIKNLKNQKPEERAQAAETLGNLGPLAAPAVTDLVKALGDKNPEVQFEALMALGHIGPAARSAVPSLVTILKSDQKRLHIAAIDTVGSIGREAMSAVPALFTFVRGDDPQAATSAGLALARILPPGSDQLRTAIPVLIKSLGSISPEIHDEAVVALAQCGRTAVPALSDLVAAYATNSSLAAHAAAALAMMGPDARDAAPQLIDALKSRDEKLVAHAADALGAIGPAAEGAVKSLRGLLAGKSVLDRIHAAQALGNIGRPAAPAVPDLAKALKDNDEQVRRIAADALGQIGPPAAAAVPALVAALRDDSGAVTLHAAGALGRIGPDAAPALAELVKDPKLNRLAVMILSDLGPAAKPAVKALASALSGCTGDVSDDDREFCREILLTLAHIGPEAQAAGPTLLKILGDEKHQFRAGAAWALASIGIQEAVPLLKKALETDDRSTLHVVAPSALMLLDPGNDEYVRLAVPNLIVGLDHKSGLVRREVAGTLAMIGPKAAPAVEKLTATLDDADPSVRGAALAALAAIGPASAGALPKIIPLLTDTDLQMRYSATFAAGKIGPAARQAVPLLEKNLQERDDFLQSASAWALVHIDPKPAGRAAQCLGPLTQALRIPDPRVRSEMVQGLALLGPSAKPAAKALQEIANDPDENVRKAVAEALIKIGN